MSFFGCMYVGLTVELPIIEYLLFIKVLNILLIPSPNWVIFESLDMQSEHVLWPSEIKGAMQKTQAEDEW